VDPLSVAILAGGKSRRMGQDKAQLRIGRRTLLEIVAARVRPVATELFVVATNGSRFSELGFRVVADIVDDAGSLGGIYSALKSAAFDHCLVVGCDMPMLNPELLKFMAAEPRDYDALVPVHASTQSQQVTYETLHAIYAQSAVPVIERRIFAGKLKIADLLDDLTVREIDESTLRRYDPDLHSFHNANTPDDFASIERMMLTTDQ
jgi:molybdopterin-guanine dinucleotide biosynthesis protein A